MSHTYTRILVHAVWSTKRRQALMPTGLRERLFPYMIGIARTNVFHALAVGGTENHAHALLAVPANLPIPRAMQLLKGSSSRWVHDTFPEHRAFAWQDAYGAFTIGASQVDRTIAYIRNQEEHHRKQTFEEEFIGFLAAHGVEYDPRYVFG